MKLYLLTNMYCGGEHPGIQGLHAVVRLMTKYNDDRDWPTATERVLEWAEQHETAILLRSGREHEGMKALKEEFEHIEVSDKDKDPLPFSCFFEPGMNNTLTSIAVICTTEMVEDMDLLRAGLTDSVGLIQKYGIEKASILMEIAYMRLV